MPTNQKIVFYVTKRALSTAAKFDSDGERSLTTACVAIELPEVVLVVPTTAQH
jgi:hypothetical protein